MSVTLPCKSTYNRLSTADATPSAPHGSNDERKAIRRAERAPWNRLMSVLLDAEWVVSFCTAHLSHLPIVPNLRCGAWYVPPSLAAPGCYYKSTDGHTNEWGFSLKRYNPAVLALIQERNGCVIVDSTRRGKSMPDALSKTIPIWCAVINAAVAASAAARPLTDWNSTAAGLCLPKDVVSPSEQAQIARRIDDWVDDLLESDLVVPQLRKPLRPVFVTLSHVDKHIAALADIGTALDYYPIVLISASPMGQSTPDIEPKCHKQDTPSLSLPKDVQKLRQEAKFVYVQGSGDDEEMWSNKMTPKLMWDADNLRQILQTRGDESALETAIATIVLQDRLAATSLADDGDGDKDCQIGKLGIWFGRRSTTHDFDARERAAYRLIVHTDGLAREADAEEGKAKQAGRCNVLRLGLESGKRGLHPFREAVPDVIVAAQAVLPGPILLCSSEGDGIGHDLNGGLAVCLLASCFEGDKRLLPDLSCKSGSPLLPSGLLKNDVQKRLQWITTFLPHAKAPSRKHMLRINEALLSQDVRAEIEQERIAEGV